MRSLLLILLLTLPVASPAPGQEGTRGRLTGTVRLESAAPERAIPSRYRRAGASKTPSGSGEGEALSHTVVYLEPLEGTAPTRLPDPPPTLGQRDQTFIPHVLPVQTGTTVLITNQDGVYHNVFSLSPPAKFDIGRRPTGEDVPLTFDEAGVVRVFCDIHATMSAFVVVVDTPWFTTADEEGSFAVDDLPPGRYTVRAWHPGGESEPMEVTVEAGSTLELDLVVR